MTVGYEFATIEWIWDQESIQLNVPGHDDRMYSGAHQDVVQILTGLGYQGWDVATCAAGGNWLFWTLRRPID